MNISNPNYTAIVVSVFKRRMSCEGAVVFGADSEFRVILDRVSGRGRFVGGYRGVFPCWTFVGVGCRLVPGPVHQ